MPDRKRTAIAFALGMTAALVSMPATAGGCSSYDTAYCGYDEYDHGDRGARNYRERDDYGYRDHGYRHHNYRRFDRARYYDDDGDWGGGYRLACDPDGDRCYRSRSGYWDYHEYYRRNGYHWN